MQNSTTSTSSQFIHQYLVGRASFDNIIKTHLQSYMRTHYHKLLWISMEGNLYIFLSSEFPPGLKKSRMLFEGKGSFLDF